MNRNTQSHFALSPVSLDIGRSQFNRSSGVKFSANVGELIPFYVDEILPGDTFKIKSSKVIRLQTLLHPIMDNIYADVYWFFVPNRLVWTNWKRFMGESPDAWTPDSADKRVPKLNMSDSHPNPGQGSLMDYMGIPLGVTTNTNSGANPSGGINALPFRAYAKVCDDWFRSEALTDPLVIPTGDSDEWVNAKSDSDLYCAYGGPVFKACKFHDVFTSSLPAPQSGPAVKIPAASGWLNASTPNSWAQVITGVDHAPGTTLEHFAYRYNDGGTIKTDLGPYHMVTPGLEPPSGGESVSLIDSDNTGATPVNLWAKLTETNLGTINDLRIAFQIQKFYERWARSGRRYIETIKAMFGVTSPDARLQRSEYLGGNRIPINISEVTNNSASESSFLGDLGAMSRTVDVHNDFVHSFTEHGTLLGLVVLRYDHSYPQGLDRFWSRTTMWDYYWPQFANIGEVPVFGKEINFSKDYHAGEKVFGYQEAYYDYRYKPSRVCGEMRPEASGSLASWHLSDYYSQEAGEDPEEPVGPFLSDSWIREDKSNVDRCLAVTSAVSNQYFADIWIQNICTRVMPMYSIPGLADHH